MDLCRRRPIGLCADAQIRDDGPNMETYHEGTYRSSRVGHADCGPDIRSPRERGSDVPGELLIRVETRRLSWYARQVARLLTDDKLRSATEGLLIGPPAMRRTFGDGSRIDAGLPPDALSHRSFSQGDGVSGSSKRGGSPMNFLCANPSSGVSLLPARDPSPGAR